MGQKIFLLSFLLIIMALLLLIGTGTSSAIAEIVMFGGTVSTAAGDPLMLTGKLMKPQGDGPFPAVVLLHGCGGIVKKRDDVWAERLTSWGYIALQVDSFGPRGHSSICDNLTLLYDLPTKRAQDAYDAKLYLAGLPFADRNQIAVMGWSHGGWTTLRAISLKRNDPFRAAIAFYPYCDVELNSLEAPLLILIGDLDDWTPASECQRRMPWLRKPRSEVILKVYPAAHHGFDVEGMDRTVKGVTKGHRLVYNPAATADAVVQVRNFLAKHLK